MGRALVARAGAAAAAALALVTIAGAQAATIELRPRWTAGERKLLHVVKEREESRSGSASQRTAARVDIDIEVQEAGPGGWVVQWTPGPTRLDGESPSADLLVRELSTAALAWQLALSPSGTIAGARNWAAVRSRGEAAVARIVEQLRREGADERVIAGVAARGAALFGDERRALTYLLREAVLYYSMFGRAFVPGEPAVEDAPLPNPLGGAPFPARLTVTLSRLDDGGRRATIDTRQTVDPVEARRVLLKTFADLADRTGGRQPTTIPEVAVDDAARFVADVATGWIASAEHVRRVTTGRDTRVDRIALSLAEP